MNDTGILNTAQMGVSWETSTPSYPLRDGDFPSPPIGLAPKFELETPQMKHLVLFQKKTPLEIMAGWWFGTFFIFPYIGFLIIPIDKLIFFRGVFPQPPTRWAMGNCTRWWFTQVTQFWLMFRWAPSLVPVAGCWKALFSMRPKLGEQRRSLRRSCWSSDNLDPRRNV